MTEVPEKVLAAGNPAVSWEKRRRRRESTGEAFRPARALLLTAVIAAASTLLLVTCFFPLLRIYGGSMAPTLNEGEVVAGIKGAEPEAGELCAFYYGDSQILIKRVIAVAGDTVDMDADGNVYVNGELLEEPYLTEKSAGDLDISLPLTVPEGEYFVMGDHRSTSLDSRASAMGCISEENVIGKVIFRVWPLDRLGFVG